MQVILVYIYSVSSSKIVVSALRWQLVLLVIVFSEILHHSHKLRANFGNYTSVAYSLKWFVSLNYHNVIINAFNKNN